MAFENVNVSKLKWAISSSDVSSRAIMKVNDDVYGNNFWDTWKSTSNERIKNALSKLINSQKEIDSILESFKNIADKIDEYKKLESKNRLYQSNIRILKPFEYRLNGEINQDVSNKIKNYQNAISQNESRLNQIKVNVDSLL